MASAGPLISMQVSGKFPSQLQLVASVARVQAEGKNKAGSNGAGEQGPGGQDRCDPASLNLLPSVILTWIKGEEKTAYQLVWKNVPKVRDCEAFKEALNHLLRDDPVLKGIKMQQQHCP